jgi:hypothetical protein
MKKDWKTYQVNIPGKGVKLISELTITEARNELCECIDILEKVLDCNRQALKIANNED